MITKDKERADSVDDDITTHTVTGGGGVDLRVDETGTDSGRPILFIHGWGASRLHWTNQMHSDLADDFRLVTLDNRGHGRSDKPEGEEPYSDPELWAADYQAVIDELGLTDPVLVGLSQGSLYIADYLSVNGEDDIGGIVLVGGTALFEYEDLSEVLGEEFLELVGSGALFSNDAVEYIMGLDAFIPLLPAEPFPPKDHFFMLGQLAIVPPHVRAALLNRPLTYEDLLPEIESPVLLTHGEEDDAVPLTVSETHAEAIPNARTSFYPGVGHMSPMENTQRFNRELREFVAGL